jgi:hypothetical protein
MIDPVRDGLGGTWTKERGQLRAMGDADFNKLQIPVEVPPEFKLKMLVAREPGSQANNEAMIVGFPIATARTMLDIDARYSTVTVLGISPENETAYRKSVIPTGTARELVCWVRNTGFKLVSGNETLIDWTGNPDRCSTNILWATPGRRIALASYRQRFRIDKLELEPLEPMSFPRVAELKSDGNLLSVIDPKRDSRNGEWKLDKKGLVSPQLQTAWLRLPTDVPEQYVLTASVERVAGAGGDFLFGLRVGGNPCAISVDGQLSAGLMQLDGKSFYDSANPTRRTYTTPLLPLKRAIKIRAYVLNDSVIFICGNKEVVRWHGDPRRLSLSDFYKPPNYSRDDSEHLWLGAWESEFLIRELTLKSLDDDDAKRIRQEFKSVFPVTSQANVPLKDVDPNFESKLLQRLTPRR